MTVKEVEYALSEAVREIQALSGRPVEGIDPDSKPIGGVPGFDSLNGVEVGAIVTEKLGVDVGENPLLDDDGNSLTIRAAAVRISRSREEIHASPG